MRFTERKRAVTLRIFPGNNVDLRTGRINQYLFQGENIRNLGNEAAPALLSGFTDNAGDLLLGVDVGGLGTPIASLASSSAFLRFAGLKSSGWMTRILSSG